MGSRRTQARWLEVQGLAADLLALGPSSERGGAIHPGLEPGTATCPGG